MRDKMIRKAFMWMFCTVVISGLGYSALVLSAKPAYADTVCEPEDCTYVEQFISPRLCRNDGGVCFVTCPFNSTYPNDYAVYCNDYYSELDNCTNF